MRHTHDQVILAFDPTTMLGNAKGWLLLVVALMLIIATIVAVKHAFGGNVKKSANVTTGVLVALIPLAIAVGVGAIVFATDLGSSLGF